MNELGLDLIPRYTPNKLGHYPRRTAPVRALVGLVGQNHPISSLNAHLTSDVSHERTEARPYPNVHPYCNLRWIASARVLMVLSGHIHLISSLRKKKISSLRVRLASYVSHERMRPKSYPRKFRFWSKFSKCLDFGRNFRKSRFRSKFSKNLDFGRNFRKISILIEILQKSQLSSKFFKSCDFDIVSKNPHFSRNLRKSRFWSKIFKMSLLIEFWKKSRFW